MMTFNLWRAAMLVFFCFFFCACSQVNVNEQNATQTKNSSQARITTHVFATPDGNPLSLDIYRSQTGSTDNALPTIVYLHGGAWMFGTRTGTPDLQRFFADEGFIMVSIDYRLTPDIQFPSNLEDVRTSIRWLRKNAESLGIDADRIGLWGTSAGGHLASLAGLVPQGKYEGEEHLDYSSKVACVLDAYGPTQLNMHDQHIAQEKHKLDTVIPEVDALPNPARQALMGGLRPPPRESENPESPNSLLLGAVPSTVPERVKAANPITYVHKDAPEFLIIHGLADDRVPHTQSVLLYEALANAGANVTLRLGHGLPHTFFNMPGIETSSIVVFINNENLSE